MPLGESRVPSREVHISGMHNKEANTEVTKKAVTLEIEKKQILYRTKELGKKGSCLLDSVVF